MRSLSFALPLLLLVIPSHVALRGAKAGELSETDTAVFDYEYDLRSKTPSRHPMLPYVGGDPCVQHRVDARPETYLRGTFVVPSGAKELRGVALKLSRDGHPGPLEVRFGTSEGKSDLGVGNLTCEKVLSLYEYLEPITIEPRPVAEGQTVHFEVRAARGRLPEDHYLVFGPRPRGEGEESATFRPSYHILTDRPQDDLNSRREQPTFHHIKQMSLPYHAGEDAKPLGGAPEPGADETAVDSSWSIDYTPDPEGVLETVADDLRQFFAKRAGVELATSSGLPDAGAKKIELVVNTDAEFLQKIDTAEGYRIEVKPDSIRILGATPRGVMRGVYYIQELMRFRDAACLKQGITDRNAKYALRVSCMGGVVELGHAESSHPTAYGDGMLSRLSHHGFNAIWIHFNLEEGVADSKVFPELNDPATFRRFERLRDIVDRAKRYGIDVVIYLVSNYAHPVPESFHQKYPQYRGTDWGNAMCTSVPRVREFIEETVRGVFEAVPGLWGTVVIFDTEGFRHCGMSGRDRCPRCKLRKTEDIVVELFEILHRGMKAGNPEAQMIAWSYCLSSPEWVESAIGRLPPDVIMLSGFSQGTEIERAGVKHITTDYNITTIGPPKLFDSQFARAKAHGLRAMAKTESGASQEFLCVPYVPCMEQWYLRMEALAKYDLWGIWGTYNHYGYTPSRPVDIMLWNCWSGAPEFDELLDKIIARDFGAGTTPHVKRAWNHVTAAIREYPYSDQLCRCPGGPIQKGPSHPLWLEPGNKSDTPWRAWVNDLKWTQPWGPECAEACFSKMEKELEAAEKELRRARPQADPRKVDELDSETRVVEMMRRTVHTMRNLLRWIPLRDAYHKAAANEDREKLRKQLIAIGEDELENAKAALVLCEVDSRFGAAGQAMGARRGGLFNAPLVRYKIGLLEKTLNEELAQ